MHVLLSWFTTQRQCLVTMRTMLREVVMSSLLMHRDLLHTHLLILTHPHQLQDRDKAELYSRLIGDWQAVQVELASLVGKVPSNVIARGHVDKEELEPSMVTLKAVERLIAVQSQARPVSL